MNNVYISGMSFNFPGATNSQEFWNNLAEKKTFFITPTQSNPGMAPLTRESFCELSTHGISQGELEQMDPQHVQILNQVHYALLDAGINKEDIKGKKVGVYVGLANNESSLEHFVSDSGVTPGTIIGHSYSIAANRISYNYDLQGPSVCVDTACSSSFSALRLAQNDLLLGNIEMAIVASANIISSLESSKALKKAGMLSPNGQCRPFASTADGYVRGEGACALVLTTDEQNHIAHIKSIVSNQDGKTFGLTAPNGPSQERLMHEALERACLSVNDIDYVEAHGTGTKLGDPIEYNSIKNIFKSRERAVPVGSVKGNIGHLEAAAGFAGLVKAILVGQNKLVPAQANCDKINEFLDYAPTTANVLTVDSEKINNEQSIHCLINSFGFGGTNCSGIVSINESRRQSEIVPLTRDRNISFREVKEQVITSTKEDLTREALVALVVSTISDVLDLELGEYSLDDNAFDVGVDSLMLVNIISQINTKFGITPEFDDIEIDEASLNELIDNVMKQGNK